MKCSFGQTAFKRIDRWLAVYVIQLFLIPLLAAALWFLVMGLRGVAARICRVVALVG